MRALFRIFYYVSLCLLIFIESPLVEFSLGAAALFLPALLLGVMLEDIQVYKRIF